MNRRMLGFVLALAALAALTQTAAHATADSIAGVPAANIGVHGPIADHLDDLEVVGHAPIRLAGMTTDGIGNNGAPALVGNCAYVGRWHDYRRRNTSAEIQHGVQIIDIDPASTTYLQVVGEVAGSFTQGATSREIRAIDLPDFKLLVVLTFSDNLTNRPEMHFNTVRFFDVSTCRSPALVGTYDLLAARPHEFFLWVDPNPAHNVDGHPRILVYVTVPIEAPNLIVIDASNPTLPHLAAVYDPGIPVVSQEEGFGTFLGNYAHSVSVSPDGTRAYLSYWDAGVFTVDTTALSLGVPAGAVVPLGLASVPYDYSPPGVGNTHSTAAIPGQNAAVVGDEVYVLVGGCPYGWMRTVALGSAIEQPYQLGEYRLAENNPANCDANTRSIVFRNSDGVQVDGTFSMHNQTVIPGYAFAAWYGGGMRVVDVSNPSTPTEAGAFVPAPLATVRESTIQYGPVPLTGGTATTADDWWVETWSYPVIRNGLIHITDIRNGLFILRPTATAPFAAEVAATAFAEGNSNVGSLFP